MDSGSRYACPERRNPSSPRTRGPSLVFQHGFRIALRLSGTTWVDSGSSSACPQSHPGAANSRILDLPHPVLESLGTDPILGCSIYFYG